MSASSKRPKAQDRSKKAGFTKAGRNSRTGGKNQDAAKKAALREARVRRPLLDEVREDQIRLARERREAIESAKQTRDLNFRRSQAEIAKQHLDGMQPGTTEHIAAILMIDAFPAVEFDKDAGETRTRAAELEMRLHLSPEMLQQPNAVRYGVVHAKVALVTAYNALQQPTVSAPSSVRDEPVLQSA